MSRQGVLSRGTGKSNLRTRAPKNTFTPISPPQIFERDGARYYIIKNAGHVLMRDQYLRGKTSWQTVFGTLIAGGSSLYGTLERVSGDTK